MSESVELKYRVVCNEVHHAVLTDIVYYRNSLERQLKKETRESEKNDYCVEERCKRVTLKPVCCHNILSSPQDIAYNKGNDECDGNE